MNMISNDYFLFLGKGALPKFGRRSFVVDENRRASYDISNQPEDWSESVFTTFDCEKKLLIPVCSHLFILFILCSST